MSNIHISDLSTKIRLGVSFLYYWVCGAIFWVLVSLFGINIWEWLKGIMQPRVQTSWGYLKSIVHGIEVFSEKMFMSCEGVKLVFEKLFMSHEGVKLFSKKIFMSCAGVF